MKNTFKEEDKQKFVDFLNFVAEKADFKLNTKEALQYVRLLNYMQQNVLVKINENILEIKRVIESDNKEE